MKITLTKMSHYYENLARLKSEILELEEAISVNKLYLKFDDYPLITLEDVDNKQLINIVLKEKIRIYKELKEEVQKLLDKVDYSIPNCEV